MCSASAVSKPQFFFQKANQLGGEAVYAAPIATATILAVAPFALHVFQPEGMLTQMLTLAATTGLVLNAPRIYSCVYKHPLTTKICEQPFVQQIGKHPLVQQGTSMVSNAFHDVSSFGSKVKSGVTSLLFPPATANEPTYDADDQQQVVERKNFSEKKASAQPKPKDPSVKNSLTNQLDTLKRAFEAVPTVIVPTLFISALALRFFQPEGLITQFVTLTAASGSFFSGAKLYGKYHNHSAVQSLWKHPKVQQISNHPVTVTGTALLSRAVNKASSAMKAVKEACGRAFYPEAAKVPPTRGIVPAELPPYAEFRQFLVSHGQDNWKDIAIPEDNIRKLYTALPAFLSQEGSSTQDGKKDDSSKPPVEQREFSQTWLGYEPPTTDSFGSETSTALPRSRTTPSSTAGTAPNKSSGPLPLATVNPTTKRVSSYVGLKP